MLPESAKSPSPKSRKISGGTCLPSSVKLRRTSAMRAVVEPASSDIAAAGETHEAITPIARRLVEQHEIRERPADVDADAVAIAMHSHPALLAIEPWHDCASRANPRLAQSKPPTVKGLRDLNHQRHNLDLHRCHTASHQEIS